VKNAYKLSDLYLSAIVIVRSLTNDRREKRGGECAPTERCATNIKRKHQAVMRIG